MHKKGDFTDINRHLFSSSNLSFPQVPLLVIPEGERILLRRNTIPQSTTTQRPTKNTLRAFLVYLVVIPEGVEPSIFWMRTRRPRPLDDGTSTSIVTETSLFCKLKKYDIILLRTRGMTPCRTGVI